MMRTMRGIAPWLMGILAVAFVGWMVFDVGMDVSGQGAVRSGDALARVNGTKIDIQSFYNAVRAAQEQQRRAGGSAPITLEDQRALEDAVLEALIQQVILSDEYERRGIRVTDDEIRAAAQNAPPPEIQQLEEFQTEGEFDVAKYRRYISANADPAFLFALESRYREEIPQSKWIDQLTADVYVPTPKLWRMYRDANDSVSVVLLTLAPAASVPDSAITLDDEEVERYYRRNRDDFERPTTVYLSYVRVSRLTKASDSAAALERAAAIRQELIDGADFAEVAARESSDSVSAAEGGDLGEVTRDQMIPEFERAALALRPGQISSPVLTPFGYHVIKLESRAGDRYRARHVLIPVELSGDHLESVELRADSLDRFAAEQLDLAMLDSVATWLRSGVRQAPPLHEGDRLELDGFFVPDVGLWAFGLDADQTSQVIEDLRAYYVFRVDSMQPERVPPLKNIEDEVRRAARLERKWDGIRDLAQSVEQAVRAGADLEQAGRQAGLQTDRIGPFTRTNPAFVIRSAPRAIGAAFGLGIGQASAPIETANAIYFVEPKFRQVADSSTFLAQLDLQRLQASQAARQARVRLVLADLREKADVLDRRAEIEAAQRAADALAELPR